MIGTNDPNMKDGPFLDGATQWAESLAFLPFSKREGETEREVVDRSVVEDVHFLRKHPLIKPSIPITGWVYNLENGAIEEIDCGLQSGIDPVQIELLKEEIAKRMSKKA